MAKIELTSDKISRLRYIDKTNLKRGIYDFPDFLLIGPQRTGTTWLFRNLVRHPEVFMPYEKELFFFSHLTDKTSKYYHSDTLEWYSSKFVPTLRSFIRRNFSSLKTFKSIKSMRFSLNGIYSPYITGEATASYAVMDEALINEIARLHPDIKAIMLLRNPIDRAWSHAKKDLLREPKRSVYEVDFKNFENFCKNDYQIRCGQYTKIIDKWKRYVKEGNFFIDLFDNIFKNPSELLERILGFLGVLVNSKYSDISLTRRIINPTAIDLIPVSHKKLLFQLFQSEINKVNETYGANWEESVTDNG